MKENYREFTYSVYFLFSFIMSSKTVNREKMHMEYDNGKGEIAQVILKGRIVQN